jgi:hypothetical protein
MGVVLVIVSSLNQNTGWEGVLINVDPITTIVLEQLIISIILVFTKYNHVCMLIFAKPKPNSLKNIQNF